MKVSAFSRPKALLRELQRLSCAPLSFQDAGGLPRVKRETLVCRLPCDLNACDLDFFFDYDIFPRSVLEFVSQWRLERRAIRVGDVVAQQARFPPGAFSLKLTFGVRILSCYRSEEAAGFSYGTLLGHPESGTNEFAFKTGPRGLTASIETRAVPGPGLGRALGPLLTTPYARYCNQRALERMASEFLARNPDVPGERRVSETR